MTEHDHPAGHRSSDHGVHTDPAALLELSAAAEHEHAEAGPDGAVAGYRANRTLGIGVELRRQLRRRRTQWLLGLVALLPFILVLAFEIGESNPNRRSGGFVDLATTSAPNFVVFTLLVSGSFLLPMIVALFFGDTIASEASWSSLKYLLAIPVPRHRVLRQKAIVASMLSALAILILPLVALTVGIVRYGASAAISPTGDAVAFADSVLALLLVAIFFIWLIAAQGIYTLTLGPEPPESLRALLSAVFTTALNDQVTFLRAVVAGEVFDAPATWQRMHERTELSPG
jgi:ABC-2 type transport system permease protein